MRRGRFAFNFLALLGLLLLPVTPAAAAPGARHGLVARAAAPFASVPTASLALPPIPAIPGHFTAMRGKPVEVPRLRSRFGRTVSNGDGTFTATYTPGAQNYRDANGNWQPIDDTLVDDTRSGYAWTTRANSFAAHLPAALNGAPVAVDQGGAEVAFGLRGATAAAGSASGTAATYPNALPGVALAYALAGAELKETLTLASAAAPSSYVFSLSTTGLTAKASADGGVDFVDGQGNVPLRFAAPVMRDAKGAESRAITLTLGNGTVTLAADAAWLADPARAYPVVLDPTVVGDDSQDCDIQAASPATSFCQSDDLDVGLDGANPMRTLVQFPITPSAVTVLDATVSLYLFGATTTNPTDVALQQVTTPWTTGATWQTSDGAHNWQHAGGDFLASPSATATGVGGTTGTWISWHPTALVTGWVDGTIPNDGLLLKEATENVVQDLGFCPAGSRGADNGCTAALQPTLSISYVPLTGIRPYYAVRSFPLTDRMSLGVNLANGNLVVSATDLAIAGTGLAYVFDRYYNEQLGSPPNFLGGATGGGVGLGFNADGSAYLFLPGGAVVPFLPNGQGGFVSPPGLDATLVAVQGGYVLTFQTSGLRYVFAAGGQLAYILDPNGNTITLDYTGSTLTGATDSQGRGVAYHYNAAGNLDRVTDWTGRYVQYGYNASNQLQTYTDANNRPTVFGYDPATGSLTSITDPLNNVATISYNASAGVQSLSMGQGAVTEDYTFTYANGTTTITDGNQHQTSYQTDLFGRPTQATDALNNSQRWAWTSDDHVQTSTDAKNQQWQYTYDDTTANCSPVVGTHLLCQVAWPTGAKTSAGYAPVANIPGFFVPTSTTDAQGNTISYTPDGNGNITAITNQLPSQNQTLIYYNANGTIDHIHDARGNDTHFGYDAVGNLRQITPPAPMQPTLIVPDALSRPQQVTDGKGQQRTYTYDGLDRPTALTYPADAAGNVTWVPDADGNIRSMTDSTGTTSYGYDARNRQTSKTLPAVLGGGSLSYGYDPVGNMTSFTDAASVPGQTLAVSYFYNQADELITLDDQHGQTAFTSDPNHYRQTTTYPDGVVMTETRDNSERLSSIVAKTAGGTVLTSYAYSYAKGTADTLLPQSVTQTTTAVAGQVTNASVANNYDALNRLTKWLVTNSGDGSTIHDYVYQYDGNSNRTLIVADPLNSQGKIAPDPSQGILHSNENDLAYNPANELGTILAYGPQYPNPTGPATTTYSYDPAGNQTGNDGAGDPSKALTIQYQGTNQTQSITNANQEPVTLTWAGAGQSERVVESWTHSGVKENAVSTYGLLGLAGVDGANDGDPSPNPTVASWIVRDPSGRPIFQRYGDGTEHYYLLDGQGNVVALEDPGTIQAAYDYCPTGNNAALPGAQLTAVGLNNPLRQGGVPYDDGTKDYFNGNGCISEDYSGICAQYPAYTFADETPGSDYTGPWPEIFAVFTPVDLYAFGGSPDGPNPGPRGARSGVDLLPDASGLVNPEFTPFRHGASAFDDPNASGLSGNYYVLPAYTPLPPGIGVQYDGSDIFADSQNPPGHWTFVPTVPQTFDQFQAAFKSLGWQWAGRIR